MEKGEYYTMSLPSQHAETKCQQVRPVYCTSLVNIFQCLSVFRPAARPPRVYVCIRRLQALCVVEDSLYQPLVLAQRDIDQAGRLPRLRLHEKEPSEDVVVCRCVEQQLQDVEHRFVEAAIHLFELTDTRDDVMNTANSAKWTIRIWSLAQKL